MKRNRPLTIDGAEARHTLAATLAALSDCLCGLQATVKSQHKAAKIHLRPMERQAMTALVDNLGTTAGDVQAIAEHILAKPTKCRSTTNGRITRRCHH
jgi:hypothetical protein